MRRVSAGGTVVVAALAVLLLSVSTSSQVRRAGQIEIEIVGAREAAAREILVKFREPPQAAQLGGLAADANAEDVQPVGRSGVIRIVSRTRSAAALLAALANRPDIAFAEPNYVVQHTCGPERSPAAPALGTEKHRPADQRPARRNRRRGHARRGSMVARHWFCVERCRRSSIPASITTTTISRQHLVRAHSV